MELDYGIKTLDERMEIINQILEKEKDKIEKYFGNPSINYMLQGLANYILNCDHKQTHKEKMQNNFENSVFELTNEEAPYTLFHKTKIKKSDYKNQAIKEKRDLIVHIFNKYGDSSKAKRWIQDLKYDQVMIKQSEKGYIKPQLNVNIPSNCDEYEIDNYWHDVYEITCNNSLLNLDLFEIESWKTILKMLPYREIISGNVDRLISIFNQTYLFCDFTDLQKEIICEYRDGVNDVFDDFVILKNKDIEQKLKIEQSALSHNIESICNKLINAYEKLFIEYYYTFLVRGSYKKCSKCGKNKILDEFKANSTSKDGKYSICKECMSKK